MTRWDREAERVRGKTHGDKDHACSWACPGSNPMADVRSVVADIGAGMSSLDLYLRHYRSGPFSFGPDVPEMMRPTEE